MNLKKVAVGLVFMFLLAFAVSIPSQTLETNETVETIDAIVSCETISESGTYALTEDLNASGDCLVITADNVTIDGNAHTIFGNGTGSGITTESTENVTIEDTTISDFETGIEVSDSNSVQIMNNTISETNDANVTGIDVNDSSDVTIADNSIDVVSTEETATGIEVSDSTDTNISDNSIVSSGTDKLEAEDSTAIELIDVNDSTVSHNTIDANASGDAVGVELKSDSSDVSIQDNNIVVASQDENAYGIQVNDSADVNISDNSIDTTTVDSDTLEEGIEVSSNGDSVGIEIDDSNQIEISGNDLNETASGDAVGVKVDSNSSNIQIGENQIELSTSEGINYALEIEDSSDSNVDFSDNTISANEEVTVKNEGLFSTISNNQVRLGGSGGSNYRLLQNGESCENCGGITVQNDRYSLDTNQSDTYTIATESYEQVEKTAKNHTFTTSTVTPDARFQVTRVATRIPSKTQNEPTPYQFTVLVQNNTGKAISNVVVLETIAKEVAADASQVDFQNRPARVIQSDPVVEWTISALGPKKVARIEYLVVGLANQQLDGNEFRSFFKEWEHPSIQLARTECTRNTECSDQNPCTVDTCEQGNCRHSASQETACQPPNPGSNPLLIPVLVLLAVLFVTAFLIKKKIARQ